MSSLTNEQFKEKILSTASSERWTTMPQICRELFPQLVSCSVENGEAMFKFRTADWMGNPARHLHGGIIATIFDNAMGTLVSGLSGSIFTPTVSMNIDYLRSIPCGDDVYVVAKLFKTGRTLAFISAEMYLSPEAHEAHATASAVYSVNGGRPLGK
jgi:uncharacterized protein (TIGR00369 family)